VISFTRGYRVPSYRGVSSSVPLPANTWVSPTASAGVSIPMPSVGVPEVSTALPVDAVERAVVWGGVPLCAWLAVTRGGLSGLLAAALGGGILYLKAQGVLE
jgi:hypothetical protein